MLFISNKLEWKFIYGRLTFNQECPSRRTRPVKVVYWNSMRTKPEKHYSVHLESHYISNDIVAFMDIMAIALSFFLVFVLLSVIVVLFRAWLYY